TRSPPAARAGGGRDGIGAGLRGGDREAGAVFPLLSSGLRFLDRIPAGFDGPADAAPPCRRLLGVCDPPVAGGGDQELPGDGFAVPPGSGRTSFRSFSLGRTGRWFGPDVAPETLLSERSFLRGALRGLLRGVDRAGLLPEQVVHRAGPDGGSLLAEPLSGFERRRPGDLRADHHLRLGGLGDVARKGVLLDHVWNDFYGDPRAHRPGLRDRCSDVARGREAALGRHRGVALPGPRQHPADLRDAVGLSFVFTVSDRLVRQLAERGPLVS